MGVYYRYIRMEIGRSEIADAKLAEFMQQVCGTLELVLRKYPITPTVETWLENFDGVEQSVQARRFQVGSPKSSNQVFVSNMELLTNGDDLLPAVLNEAVMRVLAQIDPSLDEMALYSVVNKRLQMAAYILYKALTNLLGKPLARELASVNSSAAAVFGSARIVEVIEADLKELLNNLDQIPGEREMLWLILSSVGYRSEK